MKKLWFGLLATLLLVIFVVPAVAWEFEMKGDFEYRFRYFGRANGYQDLFGNMQFQDSVLNNTGSVIGFAGPNFFRGYNGGTLAAPTAMVSGSNGTSVRIVRGGFSLADSDAYAHDQRMTFVTTLRVNKAITLNGNIDLASIRQKYNHRDYQTNGPLDRWYQDRTSRNAFDTAMIPSINQWRLGVQLPWGIMSVGAKDFPFGTGATAALNSRASSFVVVAPYGPFRFIPGIWLARGPDAYANIAPYTGLTVPGVNGVVAYDTQQHWTWFWHMLLTYQNGPLEFGGGLIQAASAHFGPSGSATGGNTPRTTVANGVNRLGSFSGRDLSEWSYILYAKYNNGRFFANLEYTWDNVDFSYLGTGVGISGAPPLSVERSLAFAEGGALCGPAKLSTMFAWSGGAALNNNNPTKEYGAVAVNYQATDAYNYLMFHTYGGGNNAPWTALAGPTTALAFTNDENGQMTDAWALAARLDYAAAANLNLWGSYMWASRVEQNGFWAGGVTSDGTPGFTNVADSQAWKQAAIPGAGANMNPYVDDSFLGWEAQLGVDWKLLENFSANTRYAYWQPGEWFDQAYRVIGLLPGGAASPNAFMKGRSAIQAITTSVVIDF